ncbi:hypothetical protein MRX96_046752 [Rhipicephalus microplus]
MPVLQSIGRSFPLLAYAVVRPHYRTVAGARFVNQVGPFFTNHWAIHHRTNSCTNQEGTWGHVALPAGKALLPCTTTLSLAIARRLLSLRQLRRRSVKVFLKS